MFNLIDIGRSVGGGIPAIFRVWREQGWTEPIIEESSRPDRTVLSLSLLKKESSDKQVAIKSGDKGAKSLMYSKLKSRDKNENLRGVSDDF